MLQLQETAEKNGHQVFVSFAKSRSNAKKQVHAAIPIGSIFSRNLHLLLSYITGLNGCFSLLSTLRFLRRVKKEHFDLIHLHNLHNCYINLPLLFGFIKRQNIPVIWTLHDCWAFTGICPHFQISHCEKWKTGCYNCTQYREYPGSLTDRTRLMYKLKKKWFTGVQAMYLVAPSRWLAALARHSFLQDYPITVIHNGIDLSVFKPTESDFRAQHRLEGKIILLGVALSWDHRKGLDVFIELCERLDNRFQIVLVGTNDQIDAQLPDKILSVHRTQNPFELAAIYTAADLFVNPTKEEVLGMVNLESLACGTPVITFDTGGSPECLTPSCGCVVPKNDIDTMYKEIIRICADSPYASSACLEQAKRFNMNERFAEYIRLYEEINES